MVLSANTAATLTSNALATRSEELVAQEIANAEARIRAAAGLGATKINFNATLIGNPIGDPQISTNLATENQIDFRDAFNSAGYMVSRDPDTGYWVLDWTVLGIETQVNLYTFRTTLAPGAISAQTITAIGNFFTSLVPVAHANAVSNNNIDETQFGAPASTFYEYSIVVDQSTSADHSSALKAAVIAAGLGYNSGNCNVYKLI